MPDRIKTGPDRSKSSKFKVSENSAFTIVKPKPAKIKICIIC